MAGFTFEVFLILRGRGQAQRASTEDKALFRYAGDSPAAAPQFARRGLLWRLRCNLRTGRDPCRAVFCKGSKECWRRVCLTQVVTSEKSNVVGLGYSVSSKVVFYAVVNSETQFDACLLSVKGRQVLFEGRLRF